MELTIKIKKDKKGKTELELFNPDKLDNATILGILKILERATYNKLFADDFEFKHTNKEG